MIALLIMIGILAAPFVLWIMDSKTLAIFMGFLAALSMPSIGYAAYRCIKSRSWPKIVGGPGISWAGKWHIGLNK